MDKRLLPLAALAVLAAVPAAQAQSAQNRGTLETAGIQPERGTMAAVQQRLREEGYNVAASGTMEPGMDRSVAQFQKDHGLRPTGEVDLPTIAALGITVRPQLTAQIPAERTRAPAVGQSPESWR